ncbi:LamG-like jellyroll fold domain-containing protein [Adonisia turfae]|uniref:Cyanobactin biosynthesis PatC/TenC/TruC family protein n=1 Tax=Adonisia turfae CCMR0081 TaxID=2292702 RepID=A0A6M0RJM7_9CYAN|nr:LamG-like jellyroll fold domain-containing protein [Adonisia turfae]NEZ56013.1 cyanobactin biosynthesis PatC/TenC/TruC family protein [Adonisia turfae CCMR0081]
MAQVNSSQQPDNTPASNSPALLSVLSFNGQGDCVDLGVQPHFKVQKHLTLELWVWIESQRQWAGLISKIFDTGSTESGYGLLLDGNSGVYFGVKVPRHQMEYLSSGAGTVPLKEWHHIAATYDGKCLRVYVDGVEKALQTLADSSIDYVPDNNLRLGMYRDDNETYAFHGSIADVRLWEVARTQAEIQGAMGRRLTGTEAGLIGYWPMAEGTGTTTNDHTTNASHGAISGASWSESALPILNPTEAAESSAQIATVTLPNNSTIKLKSWKGDYLHRPDSAQGVTSWSTGVGNEWIVEAIDNNKIKLKSWKGDYLHRPDSAQGVTTWHTGVGNEWTVEAIDNNKIKLKSWKGDYLHRPDSIQGVTSWSTGVGNEWVLETINTPTSESPQVLQFDGQDDYVAVAIAPWETSTFSIELWAKAATISQRNYSSLFNSWDGATPKGSFQLDILNGSYRFLHSNTQLLFTQVSEEWLHLAVTYDGSTLVTYVNGEIANQRKKALTISFKDYIFGRNRNRGCLFKGELSEIRIWNRARTQAEIQADGTCRLTGNEPGLVAYFPISEGVGNTTNDKTTDAKQGNIYGATWTTSSGLPIAAGTPHQLDATTTQPETIRQPETTTSPETTNPPETTSPPAMTTQPDTTTSTLRWVLQFDGIDDYVELPPASIPSGKEITCSFWAFGGDALPNNNSLFAAFDAAGTRLLNIHLPWGNGSIYFDCGCVNSTYDRINKQSSPAEFKGKWSHWAFTKNCATGEMKIYLNGDLWHSGSGKTRPIPKAIRAQFGSYAAGSYHYQGMLAEVQFWNYARSQAEIRQSMNSALTGTEAGLISYYPMQRGAGNTILNKIGDTYDGTMQGAMWMSNAGLSIAPVPVSPPRPTPMPPNPVTPITTSPAQLSIIESCQPVLKLGQNHQGIAVGSGALSPQGQFTLEAWICPSGITGQQVILADGEALLYLEGGDLKFRANANAEPLASKNAGLTAGNWYHVAVVCSGSQADGTKLYFSGERNDNQLASGAIASGGSTYLGGHPNLADAKFQGYLTEVRVWRLVRSQAEIKANMSYRLTGQELGLIRYWPLNEGSGAKISDKTTYRAPGDLMGEITYEEVDVPLKLQLEPQERLTRSTGLEDYGYWYREMAKQQKAKTEADPPFLRGRIWR